jgi:hypothetical protein
MISPAATTPTSDQTCGLAEVQALAIDLYRT